MGLVGTVRATLSGGQAPYVLGPYRNTEGERIPAESVVFRKAFAHGEQAYGGRQLFHVTGRGIISVADDFRPGLHGKFGQFFADQFPAREARIPLEIASEGSRASFFATLDFEEAGIERDKRKTTLAYGMLAIVACQLAYHSRRPGTDIEVIHWNGNTSLLSHTTLSHLEDYARNRKPDEFVHLLEPSFYRLFKASKPIS